MNIEAEIADLKQRVDDLERRLSIAEGSHQATQGQLRDLRRFTEAEFGDVHDRLDGIDGRLESVEDKLDRLREDLPEIIASAVALLIKS